MNKTGAASAITAPVPDVPDFSGETGEGSPGGQVISTHPVDYNQNVPVYTSTTPASDILTGDASKDAYIRSLLTVFPANSSYWNAFKNKSAADLAILWSLTMYFGANQLNYWDAFSKMTTGELNASWKYVGNYLSKGLPLLRSTKLLPSGLWDTTNPGDAATYDAIQAIHTKYGIF